MKFLPEASVFSHEIDFLLISLTVISCLVLGLVFGLMILYAFKYRAGSGVERGQLTKKSWHFEIAWTGATLIAFFFLFLWAADLYLRLTNAPADALKIYVVGKQWMWKIEHAGGQREIDALHIPAGRPIELIMTSEDVIHDFAVPAFRVKHDVLPGRYDIEWFTADRIGTYHLFCTQFCGLDHAKMAGTVTVMSPGDYALWLTGNGGAGTLADQGLALYTKLGCGGCHGGYGVGGPRAAPAVPAPSLAGLYGSNVTLASGRVVVADDDFLRDAIRTPDKQPVAGYRPVMPAYAGQTDETGLLALIAYIKSLTPEGRS